MVLISPNYGVQAGGAWVLTMPWGGLIADLVTGGERGFEPANDAQAHAWTVGYPTSATLPMAAFDKLAMASEGGRRACARRCSCSPQETRSCGPT